MYSSDDPRQIGVLLRISRSLDIVGDVSVNLNDPSELLAWATTLPEPTALAWRAMDSEKRYVQVNAAHHRSPVHGNITAVLCCEQHRPFWDELLDADLEPGSEQVITVEALSQAWASAVPLAPTTP
ncbi:hypothetical protein [Aeromicrobium sp.]|uniref:hypothetical protein n=1 Tax=Aeromicrobium sp. TaxID=1871063 RepID=UPI002FC88199